MQHNSGFTLLEVMIALAIFSIYGLSILSVINDQLMLSNNFDKKIISSWVADNVLMEIKLMDVKQSKEWQQGRDDMANRQWYWRSKEIMSKSEQVGIIIIEVREYEGNGSPDFSLEGYRFIND